jgi:hypothetical protein
MHQNDELSSHAFSDECGRIIEVKVIDDLLPRVIALYEGSEIGYLDFEPWGGITNDDGLMLSHTAVNPLFQRAGIGTEMMREATSALGLFLVPGRSWQGGSEGRGDTLYYSTEGARFIQSCIRNKIIPESALADHNEERQDDHN